MTFIFYKVKEDLANFKHVAAQFLFGVIRNRVSQECFDSCLFAVFRYGPGINSSLSNFKIVLNTQDSCDI